VARVAIAGRTPLSKHLQTRQLCLTLFLIGCTICSTSYGQKAFLPASTIASPSAANFKTDIMAFSKDQVAKILSNNPADQQAGRDQIINTAKNQTASDSFLDTLASTLNDELMAQKGNGDLRCRLNIAITVANVAARASARVPNTKLAPITEVLLKDKSQPVCLWGIKAAGAIIPSMLINGQSPKTMAQLVIDATKEHSDCVECGAVIEEAYNALTLGSGTTPKTITAAGLRNLIPYTLQLMALRVSQYQSSQAGNSNSPPPPPNPIADSIASNFLVKSTTWAAMDPVQQSNALKLMTDLVEQLAKQLPQSPAKDETAQSIKWIGAAFQVIGKHELKSKPVEDAGTAISNISADPDPTDLSGKIDALKNAVKGLNLPAPTMNPSP